MTTDHLTPDELALYAMGALEEARAAALEQHTRACPTCAAALAREARLELSMYELAAASRERPAEPAPPRLRRRGPRVAALAFGAASLACAIALLLSRRDERSADPQLAWLIACPPLADTRGASCRAAALRRGLFVQDPPAEAAIPIYETLPAAPGSSPDPQSH